MDYMYVFTGCVLTGMWSFGAASGKGSPPKIEVPTNNTWKPNILYIRMNNSKTIICRASGDPKPRYRWLYDDPNTGELRAVTHSVNTNFSTEEGGMTVSQAGIYACVAFNKHGSTMTPLLHLVNAVGSPFPRGADQPEVKQARRSENITLECKGFAGLLSKPKSLVVWKRGPSIDMLSVLLPKENIAVDPNGLLHFLWLDDDDFRFVYGCSAYNAELLMDYGNSHSYILQKVTGEVNRRNPSLLYADDVTSMAGNNAILTCLFSYYSPIGEQLKITWRHGNKYVGEGQTLVLPVEVPTDQMDMSGDYTCEATLDSYKTMVNVRLTITSPPVFIPGQEVTYLKVVRGRDAVFRCGTRSYGTNQDSPMWFVNTKKLDENNDRFLLSADKSMLTLTEVKLRDQVCVQCQVNNQYGSAFGAGCLTVINKIKVLDRPSDRYEVLAGTAVEVRISATTDDRYEDKLKYKWLLYKSTQSEEFVNLPLAPCFKVLSPGKQLVIDIPRASEKESPWAECRTHLRMATKMKLGVNISHPYDFELLKFEINVNYEDTADDSNEEDKNQVSTESSVTAGGMKAASRSWFILYVVATIILLQSLL